MAVRTEGQVPRAVREVLVERRRPIEAIGAHIVEAAAVAVTRHGKKDKPVRVALFIIAIFLSHLNGGLSSISAPKYHPERRAFADYGLMDEDLSAMVLFNDTLA